MNAETLNLDTIDTDAPLFDPGAFGLGDEEAGLNALARRLGRTRFAPRAMSRSSASAPVHRQVQVCMFQVSAVAAQ